MFQKCESQETGRSQSLQVEEKATDGGKHQFGLTMVKKLQLTADD